MRRCPSGHRDGRELLFIDPGRPNNGRVGFSSVIIDTQKGFAVSEAVPVPREFNVTGPGIGRPRTYDILRDGRFVGIVDEGQETAEAPRIEVVLNWFEELKAKAPSK